jgi:hypothetical protein
MKRCHHVFTNPCQRHVVAEKMQVIKIVPRLPNHELNGTVSQQPISAQHRYGAALMSPEIQLCLEIVSSSIPNWCL